MKYEMIFGDEALFDGAPDGATHATKGGGFYAINDGAAEFASDGMFNGMKVSAIGSHLIAERRIIKEPKRWTWEDKKAGVLPEVGSRIFVPLMQEEQNVIYTSKNVIISISDSDRAVTRTEVKSIDRINPIETPAEKAQRLREEWKNNVIEIHHGKRRKMSTSTFLLDDIYDALLSGDLPVPVKE